MNEHGALQAVMENYYTVEAHRDGVLLWREFITNLVVTEGLTDSIDKYFKGAAYTAAFYVGLTATVPTFAAGNTMAVHAGWTEVVAYSESVRQTFTLGTVTAGSASNTASKAVFTINADSTVIGGAFVTTNNTKSGTTGILYGGGAFTADRTLMNGDVLSVTITVTASAA